MKKTAPLALVLQSLCFICAPGAGSAGPVVVDEGTVITDVTLISPERTSLLLHASVVIRDGRIAQIGTDIVAGPHAQRIDGRDRYLIPGLIDSHVHPGAIASLDDDAIAAYPELALAYRSQLPRAYLAFGFTTLVDLNLKSDTRDWFNAAPQHPNFFTCGPGVRVVGGYMAQDPPKDTAEADAENVVYEPAAAKFWPANLNPADYTPARAVERAASANAVCIKAFVEPGFGGTANWPVPSTQTLIALRDEAHRRGLVLIVHANAVEAWREVIDAHVDMIAHGLWNWPGPQLNTVPPPEAREVIQSAARASIAVQPTLQSVYGDVSIFDASVLDDPRLAMSLPRALVAYLKGPEGQKSYRAVQDEYRGAIAHLVGPSADPAKVMAAVPTRAAETLKLMLAENVKILFGSDTPANVGIGNPPGLNGRFELQHWSEAGVPLARILRAATIDNAIAFGLSKNFGSIEVGKRADLLLLRSNPITSISAYDSIDTIVLGGKAIPRGSLMPPN